MGEPYTFGGLVMEQVRCPVCARPFLQVGAGDLEPPPCRHCIGKVKEVEDVSEELDGDRGDNAIG